MTHATLSSVRILAVALLLLSQTVPAVAGLLLDYSPDTHVTGKNTVCPPPYHCALGNEAYGDHGQNWSESVLFSSAVRLYGIAIYSSFDDGNDRMGASVLIRIYTDAGGAPGVLLHDIISAISSVDSDGATTNPGFPFSRRLFTRLPFLLLDANTKYWVGMMGTTTNIGQDLIDGPGAPDDGMAWMFQDQLMLGGYELFANQSIGDVAFRLYGTLENPAPNPAVISLLLVGFGCLLAIRCASGKPSTMPTRQGPCSIRQTRRG